MEKRILIFILLLIGNGIVNAVEYPFVPSSNEHFVIEDYGSELVGLGATDLKDYVNTWGQFKKEFPVNGDWAQYVNDWNYVLEWIRENGGDEADDYIDNAREYFEQNPTAPNNPFRVSLLDDTAGILVLLISGIAYLIYKFKFKKNEDYKN